MHNTTKLLAAAMALPLALGLAVPASAETRTGHVKWSEARGGNYADDRRGNRAEQRIERRLNALTQEIRQARRSGTLNRYEARNFRQKLKTVERGYHAFARNGLSRRDIRVTMRRIGNVSDQLEAKRYRSAHRDRYNDRRSTRRGYYRR